MQERFDDGIPKEWVMLAEIRKEEDAAGEEGMRAARGGEEGEDNVGGERRGVDEASGDEMGMELVCMLESLAT